MEKAAGGRDAEQFRAGVFVSHWDDVKGNVVSKSAVLNSEQVREGVNLRDLRELAVRKGPYEVGSNNCHHMAREVFNHCAKDGYRLKSHPNRVLTGAARLLSRFGIDVGASRSQLSNLRSGGVDYRSGSQSDLYEPYPFPLEGDGAAEGHRNATDAAILSDWIYAPSYDALVQHFDHVQVLAVKFSTPEDPIQWSLVQKDATYYFVFRGTDLGGADSVRDILIDINCMPIQTESGLQVYSSMWTALRLGSLETVRDRCWCTDPTAEVVLCGHSLGGGYAILAAMDLLHSGRQGVKVITFGAPQVVVPDPRNEVWQAMNRRTTPYVNAWDLVPRLPSSRPWVDVVPKLACKSFAGSCRVQCDLGSVIDLERLTAYGQHYDHVGTPIFVKKGARKSMYVQSREELRRLLDVKPPGYDQDAHLPERVLGFHGSAEYVRIVKLVSQCDD